MVRWGMETKESWCCVLQCDCLWSMLWRPVQLWTPLWDDLFCRCMHSSQHTKFMRNRCPSRRWRPPFVRIWACIVSAPRNFTSYGLITGPVSAIIHSIIYHIHTIIMWMCFNLGPLFISHTFLGGRRRPIRMHWDWEKGAHHRKRHIDKLNAPQKCDLTSLKWTLKRNKTKKIQLTVRLPRFFTLHTKWTLLPTNPVIFAGIVVSKYGPVPGVGNSCRKSVRKRRELPSDDPRRQMDDRNEKKERRKLTTNEMRFERGRVGERVSAATSKR